MTVRDEATKLSKGTLGMKIIGFKQTLRLPTFQVKRDVDQAIQNDRFNIGTFIYADNELGLVWTVCQLN